MATQLTGFSIFGDTSWCHIGAKGATHVVMDPLYQIFPPAKSFDNDDVNDEMALELKHNKSIHF